MSAHVATLAHLLDGVAEVPAGCDVPVAGLSLDSRAVRAGDAFVALAGRSTHGLTHAQAAVARGASCVLWEPPAALPDLAVPSIRVEGLRDALGALADRFHGHPSRQLAVTGVTGTNGKTSFVHLLAQALTAGGERAATIGTLGSGFAGKLRAAERTTPDVLAVHAALAELRAEGAQHVAMEVSSHALDQGRVDGVQFAIAVFTNLTRDHLDYHADMQHYGDAKAKLFRSAGLRSVVINTDDAFGKSLLATLPAGVERLRYGVSESDEVEVHASRIRTGADGIAFRLRTPWGSANIESRLIGSFNVSNLLAVAATLGALDWDLARIVAALESVQPVPGRMQRIGSHAIAPLVVVDYAHTPDALAQSLASLRDHVGGALHVVFGCGGDRDAGKRPLMGTIAARGADRITLTDDNPRSEAGDDIVTAILAGIGDRQRVTVQRDRRLAIESAVLAAGASDAVLIAGKGHETHQEIAGSRQPFDDATVALAALERRR